MKTKLIALGPLLFLLVVAAGCVSLPPIVKVEHKEDDSNQAIASRLDAIDRRLDNLEQKGAQK